MNIDIEKICLDFQKELESDISKKDMFESCVLAKLNSLYTKQSDDFDTLLDSIEKSLDGGDIEYMSKLIKKLAKVVRSNRVSLMSIIERVGK